MKELSIKEKAKRYDEAIKKAETLYKAAEPMSGCNVILETIFPELKESEDERMLREIKRYIKEQGDKPTGLPNGIAAVADMIAWLEKVGNIIKEWGDLKVHYIQDDLQEMVDLKQKTEQGEQKPNPCDGCINRKGCIICENGELRETEHKPTDKVEPKFKVGDWVIIDGETLHITNVTEDGYSTEEGGHIPFRCEKDARAWTIQDAKDGDALCYKDEISLYKHDIKNCTKQETTFGGFVYYCCYDGKRFIMDSLYSLTEQDEMDIHPATQEQRNLLFQKMKEAGYEWDAERKELKKIEQNPAWSEEDKYYYDIIQYILNNECVGKTDKENAINWFKSLKDRVQPQNTWKPSDEQMVALDGICSYIRNNADWEISQDMISDLYKLSEQLKKLREE